MHTSQSMNSKSSGVMHMRHSARKCWFKFAGARAPYPAVRFEDTRQRLRPRTAYRRDRPTRNASPCASRSDGAAMATKKAAPRNPFGCGAPLRIERLPFRTGYGIAPTGRALPARAAFTSHASRACHAGSARRASAHARRPTQHPLASTSLSSRPSGNPNGPEALSLTRRRTCPSA